MSWYRTGTISVATGSASVAGTGTAWLDQVQPGDALQGPDGRLYEVDSIQSDTALVLHGAYLGPTASSADYAILPRLTGVPLVDLNHRLSSAFTRWQTRETEFSAWLAGSAAGGPASDGRYPLTDPATGQAQLVPCPARIDQLLAAGSSGATAQQAANQAQTAAATAGNDAISAADARAAAEAARLDAKSSASVAEAALAAMGMVWQQPAPVLPGYPVTLAFNAQGLPASVTEQVAGQQRTTTASYYPDGRLQQAEVLHAGKRWRISPVYDASDVWQLLSLSVNLVETP